MQTLYKNPSEIKNYNPREDNKYMSDRMLTYFKNKLLSWRSGLIENQQHITQDFESLSTKEADYTDEGISQELRIEESSLFDHDNNIINLIDEALDRIKSGEYGYCEKTGEEIGVARLEAWPIAKFTVEAQEEEERR
ncbi:MAG: TraR/DksA C4-type zinc finger protein [Alphaproteobacteria bacterium]|nr:TraR/DksA C4-type zinc finger protein [Alphaproteobacteria bacterium]